MKHYIPSLLDTKHIQPMDRRQSEIFFQATILEASKGKQEFTSEIAKEFGEIGKVFYKRLEAYGGKATIGAVVVCAAMADGLPGNMVMYAHTISRLYKLDGKVVDVGVLANVFPTGFPNERGLSDVWDAQKGKGWDEPVDNMLDYPDLLTDDPDEQDKQEWCKWLT